MNITLPLTHLPPSFWKRVMVSPSSSCWTWAFADLKHGGYPSRVNPREGKKQAAHRHSYETLVGPIPAGLVIDHLCRNRACVNPDHMEPVTQREYILLGNSHSAVNARKTRCPQGHEYTYHRMGHRTCGPCMVASTRSWRRKRKLS